MERTSRIGKKLDNQEPVFFVNVPQNHGLEINHRSVL